MPRLLDFYAPLISFGLALDAGAATGDGTALQQQARSLVDQARAQAAYAGHGTDTIESASFAMVAWIDEVLARHAGSQSGDAEPLQQQLFNSRNAHSEFFHHLSALKPQDDELREVYLHALALGFKGQYYFETGDQGELGKLKALHAQQLQARAPTLAGLANGHITPQPYAAAPRRVARAARRRSRASLVVGGVVALMAPLACLAWLLAKTPGDAPSPLARQIDQQLQSLACADLSTQVWPDGSVRVHGFVPKLEDMQRVRADVAAIPGVQSPQFDLGLRIWPHCEVLSILKPYQARNRDKAFGLRITVPTAREGRLREGDPVLLQVTNANFDGYIWVDYYTADGSVLHFYAGRGQPRMAAGESIELGRDTPASWLVSPPFGTVMITALASPAPFAETADRPPFELASAYLLRLREMLASNRGAERLVADYIFLETGER